MEKETEKDNYQIITKTKFFSPVQLLRHANEFKAAIIEEWLPSHQSQLRIHVLHLNVKDEAGSVRLD